MTSRIETRILQAAVELFGAYGPYGVTFHDLAVKAEVTPGSIYRLFRTREMLFEQALRSVLARVIDPASLLLLVFEGDKEIALRVAAAARQWHQSFTQADARLLMQASFLNHPWEGGEAPLEKTIRVLAASLEREWKGSKASRCNPRAAVQYLIFGLYQLKLTAPAGTPAKDEREAVEGLVQFWLKGLAASAGS